MNKNHRKTYAIVTMIAALLINGVLSGCASSKRMLQPPKPAPEDPALSRKLPEMNSSDYEAAGDMYLRNNNYTMAFVQYEKALALAHDDVKILYKQGMLFLYTGQNEKAASVFRRVLEKDADHYAAHEALGMALLDLGDLIGAETHSRTAVTLAPTLWKARNCLGNIYDKKRKYNDAIRQYNAGIKQNPQEGLLYNNLGVSLMLAERYEESIQALARAIETNGPKELVYNNMGMALAQMNRYEAALEAFLKSSDSAKAYNNLGCMYLAAGKHEQAKRAFKKAIALSPIFYIKADDNLKKIQLEHFLR